MPIEDSAFFDLTGRIGLTFDIGFVTKAFLILFLVFYIVFAFILHRQIRLMCHTLPTPASPFLKFLATVHIGVSLAVLLAVIGTF